MLDFYRLDCKKGAKYLMRKLWTDRKEHNMSTQERIELIADITAIMEQDKEDKEFLLDLLQELQEAY